MAIIFVAFAVLIFGAICFFKEKDITGYYKVAGIYGRIYSFFAFNAIFGSIGSAASLMSVSLRAKPGELSTVPAEYLGGVIGSLLLGLGIGGYMYYRVYKKSPDFLKKRCLLDLTVTGMATTFRVSLWFMWIFVHTWWTVSKPDTYVLQGSGLEVYVFPDGNVYDPNLGRFGKLSETRDVVIWN